MEIKEIGKKKCIGGNGELTFLMNRFISSKNKVERKSILSEGIIEGC